MYGVNDEAMWQSIPITADRLPCPAKPYSANTIRPPLQPSEPVLGIQVQVIVADIYAAAKCALSSQVSVTVVTCRPTAKMNGAFGPSRPHWLLDQTHAISLRERSANLSPRFPPLVRLYINAVYYPSSAVYSNLPPSSLQLGAISHVFYASAW